jgi:hypothetical protein
MTRKTDILDTLDRLAAQERAFLATRFLAPVSGGGRVQVRIGGVRCELAVEPRAFAGWGVFRPLSHARARLEREATMAERRRYLEMFPAVALVLVHRLDDASWLGRPAQFGDARFQIDGPAVVRGVEDAELFDTARARFDGSHFWFDEVDPQADPSVAAYLRESLVLMLDPRRLARPRLTAEQRSAYADLHAERERQRLLEARATGEGRVREALEHAGARLTDFNERKGFYRVSFAVDGRRHTSVVRKADLTVQSAGVCLSGQDAHFDLASLVGVLREGQNARGGIRHGLQV